MRTERIGEDKQELISVRVLSSGPEFNEIEYSYKAKGNLYGVDFDDLGTYISLVRPDGSSSGEANGFIRTADGEMLSYKVSGMSVSQGKGFESKFKAVGFYETNKPDGKLAKLCKSPIVLENHSDEEGKSQTIYYELME